MASVLIVDDDSVVCDLLERVARFVGYAASSVPDAQAALEAMATHQATVVLCDVHLRDGPNGHWLADHIRELYPNNGK